MTDGFRCNINCVKFAGLGINLGWRSAPHFQEASFEVANHGLTIVLLWPAYRSDGLRRLQRGCVHNLGNRVHVSEMIPQRHVHPVPKRSIESWASLASIEKQRQPHIVQS